MNAITSTGRGSGLKDFMNSSSLVAKVSFLLIVILVFVIVLQISINALYWLLSPSNSAYLIDGMVDSTQFIMIPQDPTKIGANTIYRSVNDNAGIEFTWSVWVFINNINTSNSQFSHIFHKGNDDIDDTGLISPNNAPGLYISPHTNELTVIMNTFNTINEEIKIPNIPLNKWLNVIIRCENTKIDVYINGTIAKSLNLNGVPKQNYGNVYVGLNGGFNGNTSNLWYYDYALGTVEINNLVKRGPNTKMVGNNAMNQKNPNYLSMKWFFYGNGDQYNPVN